MIVVAVAAMFLAHKWNNTKLILFLRFLEIGIPYTMKINVENVTNATKNHIALIGNNIQYLIKTPIEYKINKNIVLLYVLLFGV